MHPLEQRDGRAELVVLELDDLISLDPQQPDREGVDDGDIVGGTALEGDEQRPDVRTLRQDRPVRQLTRQ